MRSAAMTIALLVLLTIAGQARADLLSDAVQNYQLQEWAQAEAKLRRLLQLEPDNLMAHYYLGATLQQQGKLDEAIVHYEVVAHAPHPIPGIEATLANVYVAAGQGAKALPYLEERYRQHPSDDEVALHYAQALQSAGRYEEASDIDRQLIDSGSPLSDQARFQLGQILVNYGAYVSAVQTMSAIDPNSPYRGAANSYIKALEPVTRPLSLYAAVEGFYNTNPGGSSASLIGITPAVTGGSQGISLTGLLSSRAFEASRRIRLKLGYLYYGTYYGAASAKQLNFTGHFINPSIIFKASPKADLELKGDIQLFYFGGQKLSTNIGSTLTATYRSAPGHSINIHAAYLDKKYSGNFLSAGVLTSLGYLDARTTSVGAGTTLLGSAFVKGWNGSLTVDYNFSDEQPKHTGSADPTLAAKSTDSHFREHAFHLNANLPLGVGTTPFSLLLNAAYAYKDYPNIQSGMTYPSSIGLHIKSVTETAGAKLQVMFWKEFGLNLSIGAERTASHSHASELTYNTSRYFASLSAAY